jgi:glutamate-1-semialdehyde 2,1-aminomutase
MFGFFFHPGPVRSFDEAQKSHGPRFRRFFAAMLEGGVYLAPSAYEAGFVSLAHGRRELARTFEAARRAFRLAARVD